MASIVEVAALFDPLVHHLVECRPAFGCEARAAGVGKLVDDFDAVLRGPLPNLILLDRDRVLLAILSRAGVMAHDTELLGAGAGETVLGNLPTPSGNAMLKLPITLLRLPRE